MDKKRPLFVQAGKYKIFSGFDKQFKVCYEDEIPLHPKNYWQMANPLMKKMPIFMLQLCFLIAIIHILIIIFKPFRQPRFLSEVLAGILIGPSFIGSEYSLRVIPMVAANITPFEGTLCLETLTNLGLSFYMFMVGVEIDITPIRKIEKIALSVAMAGLVVPITVGAGLHFLVLSQQKETSLSPRIGAFFWAIALGVTSFPDLARILSDLKLMYTDLGRTVLTAAVVCDLTCWFFLVGIISIINGNYKIHLTMLIMALMIAFWVIIRPIIHWMVRRIPTKNVESSKSDMYVYSILALMLCCGYLTELCGVHSMFGAFMLGLMIPEGEVGTMIIEKIEDFVIGILLPPIFLVTGLRTNLLYFFPLLNIPIWVVVVVVLLACSAKIVSSFLVGTYFKCPTRDCLALGILMNTKGVLALIVLNEGRNMQGFDQQAYTLMMMAMLLMTIIIGPGVSYFYKPARHLKQYMHRNLEKTKADAPLRVLTCIHSTKNLSSLINLLQISNATRRSPVIVYAVHLVEMTGRASAMIIFHDNKKNIEGGHHTTREKAEAEQIVSAFEDFKNDNHAYSVQPLTVVSPYASMHEDISNFALEKFANVILIPFHIQQSVVGKWTDGNFQHKEVNQNLLATAPCSIALLVDRGLRSISSEESQNGKQHFRIAMFFIEGPDDRDALAYASRMAGIASVILTVVRFIPGSNAQELTDNINEEDDEEESGIFTTMFEREEQNQLDDSYLNEFRFKTMNDRSIAYIERKVDGGDQVISTIASDYSDFDLYVIGRRHSTISPLLFGLPNCSDFPELGRLGETLATLEVENDTPPSVLVVQRSTVGSKRRSALDNKGITGNHENSMTKLFINHRRRHDDY